MKSSSVHWPLTEDPPHETGSVSNNVIPNSMKLSSFFHLAIQSHHVGFAGCSTFMPGNESSAAAIVSKGYSTISLRAKLEVGGSLSGPGIRLQSSRTINFIVGH